MTLEITGPRPEQLDELEQDLHNGHRFTPPARRRTWRNPWLALFTVFVVAWLAYYVWPRYFDFDPAKAQIVLLESVPLHYVWLMAHVVGGSVAMVTACLQMWPWLRRNHRPVHRWLGRAYVYAGVIPGAVASIALMIVRGSWTGAIGSGLWAVLWIGTAIAGLVAVRQRRFADHRRWMIYGFALTMAIIWSRLIFDVIFRFGLETKLDFVVVNEFFGWGPWVIHLLIAQWWLNRTAKRPSSLQPV